MTRTLTEILKRRDPASEEESSPQSSERPRGCDARRFKSPRDPTAQTQFDEAFVPSRKDVDEGVSKVHEGMVLRTRSGPIQGLDELET